MAETQQEEGHTGAKSDTVTRGYSKHQHTQVTYSYPRMGLAYNICPVYIRIILSRKQLGHYAHKSLVVTIMHP